MSDPIQPLSIAFDTTGIKTGRPIIVDNHEVKVRFSGVTEKEVPDKGKMLLFEFLLQDPAPTTEGKQVKPGFALSDRVTLYDKNTPPGEVPDRALERICQIQDAFLGTGDEGNNKGKPTRPQFDMACVTTMTGMEAYIKVKVKTGEYEGNDITKYTSLADYTNLRRP